MHSKDTFSFQEVANTTGGKLITWDDKKLITNFTISTRMLKEGSLLFLINLYINEDILIGKLIKFNASGIVVNEHYPLNTEKWSNAGLGIIKVRYVNMAFNKMAMLYRSRFDIPVIQVIGSSGKTTTKEMIGAILQYNMPALVGFANFNIGLSVARQISKLKNSHKAAVFEVGMKQRGMMKRYSSIVRPTIGVVTSINRSHFVRMGSIEEIIAAKAEMLEYLSKDGFLIINGEDENCGKFPLESYKGKVLTFGFSDKCNIWASDIKYHNFTTSFKAHVEGLVINCTINTVGEYNVSNALAAIMVGLKLGITPENISKGLLNFKPYSSRLGVIKGSKHTTLVNDNFNANPDTTRLLLDEVPNFAQGRPVILVMGDMENPRENIKDYSRKVHFEIGQQIGKLKINYLFAIGKWAEEYMNGAISAGMDKNNVFYYKTPKDAEKKLKGSIIPGCIVLFKGSLAYINLRQLVRILK